jgi:restriction system protein
MLPTYEDLMPIVLKEMHSGNCKRSDKKWETLTRKKFELTDDDLSEATNSGSNLLYSRINWAFTYLTKAEYIRKVAKAEYSITDLGLENIQKIINSGEKLTKKYLSYNSPNFSANWNIKPINKNDVNEEPLETSYSIEKAIEEKNDEIVQDFKDKIRKMEWQKFELFCARLLEKMKLGIAAKREKFVRDGGFDGTIYRDEFGFEKIHIQAKRYGEESKVSEKDIKEFLYNCKENNGIFITTSYFTKDAIDAAKGKKICLINMDELVRLCRKYSYGMRSISVEILDQVSIDDDTF